MEWVEDLWPRHWPQTVKDICTGMFFGTIVGLAIFTVMLIYSSLAG